MSELRVVCILLTKNRREMALRAVRCFESQTYQNKALLIVNSGNRGPLLEAETENMWEPCFVGIDTFTIGALRNHANKYASTHYAESWKRPEIIAHWDDDDYSHPNRIAEQVALLQSSGKEAVGYQEVLFWMDSQAVKRREITLDSWEIVRVSPQFRKSRPLDVGVNLEGEAWLYQNPSPRYAIGSSLLYRRSAWERRPFPDAPKQRGATGEDTLWLQEIESLGVSSIYSGASASATKLEPRMICSIHGGNSSSQYETMEAPTWRRVPEFDSLCREKMKLP